MKKKRDKKYRPKFVAVNPMAQFFGGMGSTHVEHLQTLQARNHGAMVAIVQGYGTRDHWDLLVGAINMGNVMCEQKIGDEFRASMIAGRDALCEVGKRAMRTGKFVFKGEELKTMNEAMACHDAQLENVRSIDIDRASNEVLRRIRHGLNTTNVRKEMEKEVEQGGCVVF